MQILFHVTQPGGGQPPKRQLFCDYAWTRSCKSLYKWIALILLIQDQSSWAAIWVWRGGWTLQRPSIQSKSFLCCGSRRKTKRRPKTRWHWPLCRWAMGYHCRPYSTGLITLQYLEDNPKEKVKADEFLSSQGIDRVSALLERAYGGNNISDEEQWSPIFRNHARLRKLMTDLITHESI